MNKIIDYETIKTPLNHCYEDFDPDWQKTIELLPGIDTSDSPRGFKYYQFMTSYDKEMEKKPIFEIILRYDINLFYFDFKFGWYI